ncbi:LysR family transcriptional regulator [Nitratidesulfovibrio termitidis]|uniref:LysR family transcriptional regulator n=1 Tax=Nitratidesulfovibrio termitidis TaxID=42252 RepID=UPI000401CD97|nr:LysR family transcriptional regulator [Nitratidesulfovibrio termitidis]
MAERPQVWQATFRRTHGAFALTAFGVTDPSPSSATLRTVMELHLLRAFATVAETGTLTRAAAELHLSQSALSGQIRALEDTLGVTLFRRRARGMDLTDAGADLLPLARKALDAATALRRKAERLRAQPTGRITLGLNTDPAFLRMVALHEALGAACPDVALEFTMTQTMTTSELLRESVIDAGYRYGQEFSPDIVEHPLRDVEIRIVIPASMVPALPVPPTTAPSPAVSLGAAAATTARAARKGRARTESHPPPERPEWSAAVRRYGAPQLAEDTAQPAGDADAHMPGPDTTALGTSGPDMPPNGNSGPGIDSAPHAPGPGLLAALLARHGGMPAPRPDYAPSDLPRLPVHDANAWHALSQLPWIWPTCDCPFHRTVAARMAPYSLRPRTAAVAIDEPIVKQLVATGKGVAVLRADETAQMVRDHGVYVWPEPLAVPLCIAHRTDRSDDPALRALVEAARAVWK